MSYCIMRLEKRKANNISGMQIHNDRATENHANEDIKKELSHLNYDLIECQSYKKKINNELATRYKVNKSLRKDANLCVEVIFTSDKEFFDKLTPEQERLYFEKSLEFLKEFAGEKNVISATVHKDETTPHLHAVFIPLTDDGRLNYKAFINTKYDLIKLQDKYHEKMREYFPKLERGKSSVETQRKHLKVEEYKYEQETKKLDEIKTNLETVEKEQKIREEKIKNIENYAQNYYSVKSLVESIQEKKVLLTSDTYKITSKELATLTTLATTAESNKNEKEELSKKVKELESDLNYYKSNYKKYYSLSKDLTEFKEKFEDYSKRLEESIPNEKLKEIQAENLSHLRIKKLKDKNDVENYLNELEKIGYKNLNKVDQKFILDNYQVHDTARYILNQLKTTAKTKEKVTKTQESQKHKIRSSQKGYGIDN